MPFDCEKYGFSQEDVYGQTFTLALFVYIGRCAILQEKETREYQQACDDYEKAYLLCWDKSHSSPKSSIPDGGAWLPMDSAFNKKLNSEQFSQHYARHLASKFFLVPEVDDNLSDDGDSYLDEDTKVRADELEATTKLGSALRFFTSSSLPNTNRDAKLSRPRFAMSFNQENDG